MMCAEGGEHVHPPRAGDLRCHGPWCGGMVPGLHRGRGAPAAGVGGGGRGDGDGVGAVGAGPALRGLAAADLDHPPEGERSCA